MLNRRASLAEWGVVCAVAVSGCRDRYVPPDAEPDTGVDAEPGDAAEDSAMDGGEPDDAAEDVGRDTGEDAAAPCDGPPGLYVEDSCTDLAEGVRPFAPRYVLWSDHAAKERYVLLPEGEEIDTSNPDRWRFPIGTTFFKTFIRNGKRIETRILRKESDGFGPGEWSMRTFAWNEAQDAVHLLEDGMPNALGTPHDIPAQDLCVQCHGSTDRDVALGFSAIELNHDGTGDVPNEMSLTRLQDEGWLTDAIATSDAEIPGDTIAREGLGYLHINCGPCHGGPGARPLVDPPRPLIFDVAVGLSSVEETATFMTAVEIPSLWHPGGDRIDLGMIDDSAVLARMRTLVRTDRMPPLATEELDNDGIETVRDFLLQLSFM